MAVVIFDPEDFREIYPQFVDFTDAQLNYAFQVASLVVDNTEGSLIPYNPPADERRKVILYLLVCHLCGLQARGDGIVGNIASATEGSVSSSFSVPTNASAQWYNQTQCGATAWQLMAPFTLGGRYYDGCFP